MDDREKLLRHLSNHHPCFATKGHVNAARIHLPVCPDCNIRCLFCSRSLNNEEERPGVSKQIIQPQEAIATVQKALTLCHNLQVVGIAGPGDALVTDNALETFRLLRQTFPQLLFCLSTNGLLLEEKAAALQQVGVHSLTVTVNGVNPEILCQICGEVSYQGLRYTGLAAAKLLIAQQEKGIKKAASYGMVIKVNIVLIPGINDSHIGEIAEKVKAWGANLVNIIPLIPQYKLKDFPAPNCQQIQAAREAVEQHLTVFRHCQHCRADAIGVPGETEYRDQVYQHLTTDGSFSHG